MSEEQYTFLKFSQMELDQLNKSSKDVSATNFDFWSLILFDTNPIHSLSLQTEGKLLVPLYFLLNCGLIVFWAAVTVLLFLLLRNTSPVSKHDDVLCGVTYWKLYGKCTWERLKLLGNYFFWKNNSGRKNTGGRETTWKELPWDIFMIAEFWLLCVRFIPFPDNDAKLQQSNVLPEGPYCVVRVHWDDYMTHQFFKALAPQLRLTKNENVYCFPEEKEKKKRQKIFQKPI